MPPLSELILLAYAVIVAGLSLAMLVLLVLVLRNP
jgi:hypothetical protein